MLIRHNVHDVKKIITIPSISGGVASLSSADTGPSEKEGEEVHSDEGEKLEEGKVLDGDNVEDGTTGDEDKAADEQCWIYEQLRCVALGSLCLELVSFLVVDG